jgi:hypothetical protein
MFELFDVLACQKRYPRHEGAPHRHFSVLPSTEPTT